MEYHFSTGEPISEQDALDRCAELGFHALAFDIVRNEDEPLHWHEFETIAWVISGTGSFADESGTVTKTIAGCHLRAPAGWLHHDLAGTNVRVVVGSSIPGEQWTAPIDKDPADRPATMAT